MNRSTHRYIGRGNTNIQILPFGTQRPGIMSCIGLIKNCKVRYYLHKRYAIFAQSIRHTGTPREPLDYVNIWQVINKHGIQGSASRTHSASLPCLRPKSKQDAGPANHLCVDLRIMMVVVLGSGGMRCWFGIFGLCMVSIFPSVYFGRWLHTCCGR